MLHESHVTVQKTKCANISVQFSYIRVLFFNWHVWWIDHEDQSLVERTNTSWGEQVMSFLLPLCTSPMLHLANTQFSYPVCIRRSAVMQDFRALTTCFLSFPKSFVFSYMLGLSGIVLAFLNCANVLIKGIHFIYAHAKCARLQSDQPSVPHVPSEWPWCWPRYIVSPFLWASICGLICDLTHLLFMIKLSTETLHGIEQK